MTVNAPTLSTQQVATPDTVNMTMGVLAPTILINGTPSDVGMTASVNAPAPTVVATPTPVPMTMGVEVPIIRIYSLPAQIPLTMTVNQPTVIITNFPATVPMTLTLEEPDATVVSLPDTQELTMGVEAPTPNTIGLAGTVPMTMTVNAPTIVITKTPVTIDMRMTYFFVLFQPRIVRYTRDPVVNGGCAQCGTLLWSTHERAIPIDSERVPRGRNRDKNEGVPDDRYVRCARCGWINNKNRAISHNEGSRAGWGIRYDEQEIVPDDPLTDSTFGGQPYYPGTVDDSTP
jgi:hypothetical protein